jgi:hypothetical protein
MSDWQKQHRVEVSGDPKEALKAVEEAAEIWGGEWRSHGSGGTLWIPVSAGLRRGFLSGEVSAQRSGKGAEVVFHVDKSHDQIHVAALVVLLMGALGGLLLVAWPFYPVLIPLTPAGLILSLAAWFLVSSRLRTHSPGDFLELIVEISAGSDSQTPQG